MKRMFILAPVLLILHACTLQRPLGSDGNMQIEDTLITQSLFNDKSATINEENIQRILEGSYKLPEHIRIAIVKLSTEQRRFDLDDEDFLKTQQSYIDFFAEKLRQSARVSKSDVMPGLLVSKNPSFTSIREAAVRMQADMVLVYSITGDVYSKYKFFAKQDVKAFATTQLILMDVRTGLIPFSTVVTKDYLSQKKKEELDYAETRSRIKNEAVLLTISEIGQKLNSFFSMK